MSTAFRIALTGDEQVPPVVSSATGLGTAIFDSVTSSMSVTVNVVGLDWGPLLGQASQTPGTADDVNGVHIHNAARGANGSIVLDWPGGGDADDFAVSAVLADGSRALSSIWETTDNNSITPFTATLGAATLGADVPLYVNIHTTANGGGEIRGQLVCIATDNSETVNGTAGNDILPGLGGDDTIIGGNGNDTIDGGIGDDLMVGGLGNDTYNVDSTNDTVTEGTDEGIDTVKASVSVNLRADIENLTLIGSANLDGAGNEIENILTGNSGDNTLAGGAGDDTLDGGAGVDSLYGGTGNDLYIIHNAAAGALENAGEGTDTVKTDVSYVLGSHIEDLVLLTGATTGIGNSLDNTISGNAANNLLDGGTGVDTLYGGTGNDIYIIRNAASGALENAGEGTDTVLANVNYVLGSHVEDLVLLAGATTGIGNSLANTISGNSAGNLLDGGTGVDTLYGGAGNDIYIIRNAASGALENAGEGTDTVLATVNYVLGSHVEDLVLLTGATTGTGNSLDNTISGNAAANTLDGGTGVDSLYGGAGDDTYIIHNAASGALENAGEGTDTVNADVSYVLGSHVENLTLTGSASLNGTGNNLANTIVGNSGANTLAGGAGDDTLDGGAGVDSLVGETGNDTFAFQAGQADGDTITDFAGNGGAAGDALVFSGYGVGATFTNNDATHWQVNYNGGSSHDTITFSNGAAIDPTDFQFI